jgi:pilus assembly protein CpaD
MRSSIAPRTASGSRPVVVQLVTVSLLALALTGCKTLDDEPGVHVSGWTLIDPAQRHPIMVSEKPSTMSVRVARGSQGLTPAQKGQVASFLERFRTSDAGNSKLVIAVPSGTPNETAAVRAVDDIRQLVTAYGFSEANVAIEPYRDRDAGAPVRLSYLRYVAEGPECGRWTSNLAEDPRNLPHPNFGCAQQRNLAAQIANPADLLGPRTMEPADAERRSVVFDKYRQGGITRSDRDREDETVQGKTTRN